MRSRRPRPRESSPKVKTSLCPLFWLHPQTPHLGALLSLSLSLSLLFFLSLQHPVTIINNVFQLVLVLSFRSTPMFYLPASWFQPVSWVFALPFAPSGLPFLSLPVFPPTDLLFFFFFFFPRLCWRCLLDVCVSRCLLLCLRLLSFLMCEGQATLAHTHVRSHQSFCISCEYNIILFSERANTKSKHKEQTGQNINPRKEEKKKKKEGEQGPCPPK